jgi:chemotaxis receptor (MCP) glutamine deamidase CheD
MVEEFASGAAAYKKLQDCSSSKRVEESSFAVVSYPTALFSLYFVECLGIALYDPKNRVLGFAHIHQYGDSFVDEMIMNMKETGASTKRIKAKLNGETWKGGYKHSDSVKKRLKEMKIPVVAEYLNHGVQDIITDSATGKIEIYRNRRKPVII